MAVFGITLVRDEADIIAETVGHMLGQVDHVIVLDNGSVDGTREILDELGVEVIDDREPAHYQSRKASWLAAEAASRGADWVLPFDSDELWLSPHGRIADVLSDCPATVADAALYNHVATGHDPAGTPVERMGWRTRDPLGLPKVACRPSLPVTIAEGNHAAHYPQIEIARGLLEVRHYPYRSADQFLSKVRNGAAALAATDLPESVGEHWRMYGRMLGEHGPDAVRDWFRKHFYTPDPTADPSLIYDPPAR